MASQTTGECLVCGHETKNRCSRCLQSGIDLFFCSPDCQRLVWPGHRLFCGAAALPIRLPAFSSTEADAILANLDRAMVFTTTSGSIIRDAVAGTVGQVLLSFVPGINDRSGLTTTIEAAQDVLAADSPMQTTATRRNKMLYFGRIASLHPTEMSPLRDVVLQNLVIYCLQYMPTAALPMPPLTDRRDAEFMHRLVCYVTLLTLERRLASEDHAPSTLQSLKTKRAACATALTAFVARHFDEHFVQEFKLELPAINPSMVHVTSVV